jgi:hypothetical protein
MGGIEALARYVLIHALRPCTFENKIPIQPHVGLREFFWGGRFQEEAASTHLDLYGLPFLLLKALLELLRREIVILLLTHNRFGFFVALDFSLWPVKELRQP